MIAGQSTDDTADFLDPARIIDTSRLTAIVPSAAHPRRERAARDAEPAANYGAACVADIVGAVWTARIRRTPEVHVDADGAPCTAARGGARQDTALGGVAVGRETCGDNS